MVALNKTYDDNQPTMGDGGFPLNVGEHPFLIVQEQVKQAVSNPDNRYLQYSCVTDGGPQSGTEFMIRLNFWNSNQTAVDIAEREFNSLRIAAGVPATNESSHLINRRAIAVVAAKTKGKNAGEVYIKEYKPAVASAQAAPPQSQPPATQPPAQPAPAAQSGGSAPWHR